MPLQYLDTSAIIKRYLPERGSTWVATLLSSDPVAVSELSIIELASALARRRREGSLTAEEISWIFRQFLTEARDFAVIRLTGPVVQDAARILLTLPPPTRLRSLDALHLASARLSFTRARRRGIDIGSFITADRVLVEAAVQIGLIVINTEEQA